MQMRQELMVLVGVIFSYYGCQENTATEQTEQQVLPSTKNSNDIPHKVHPAYASNGEDPLRALYGGRDPSQGAHELNATDLEHRFINIQHLPLTDPLPNNWRKAFQTLTQSDRFKGKFKVSRWSYQARTQMIGKPEQSIELSIQAFGSRTQINRELLSTLKKIKELKGKLPNSWGDHHEHVAQSKHEEFKIERSASHAQSNKKTKDPTVLATFKISWIKKTPQPSGELRNCRYLPGLSVEMAKGFPSWTLPEFKSISTRRFIEGSFEHNQSGMIGRATWIYRNGEQHDIAIKWWVKHLEAQQAVRTSLQSLEQSWQLKGGGEVSWWPETHPEPMGCRVAGSFLTFESKLPKH